MEMGRKKKWGKKRMVLLACAAIALAACIAVFAPHTKEGSKGTGDSEEQKKALAQTQEEKLEELKANEGLYSEDSIVLADTNREQAEAIAKELGAEIRMTNQEDYAALYLPKGMTIQEVYESESYRGYLAEMSPDYYVRTNAVDARNKELFQQRPNYEVHDSEYGNQGYLDYINMQDAWGTSKGARTTVAIIDTGIDTDNAEFQGRVSDKSYNASADKVVKDYDWSVIEDTQGHGTAVAGVLAASMDEAGIAGIAPEADFLIIKCECSSDGRFTRGSDLMFGLAYAIEQDADVVNMSFGTDSNIFEKYTRLAVDSDIICVASAGNEGSSMHTYPAADENVIGVGAMDTSDWSLAPYSNFGDNSDVIAPGTVYTTTIDGNYKYETGTSLSSPIVAAAVALYRSQYAHTEFSDILELLKASSTDLGTIGEDWYYGFGNLDVYAFLCEEKGTITYDMLTDEVKGQTQIFVKGHAVQYMPEPERENVVFDGWYYDMECTDEVEYYEDVFTNDVTLYAKWANEDEGTAYIYTTLSDGTVEIQSYVGKRHYLTVPSEIEGKTVSSIGEDAFSNNGRLRTVVLPQTITKIGGRAFQNCTLLRSMDIPEQVASIGEDAFYGCIRLSNVGIAKNGALAAIEKGAFSQCGIASFDIPVNLSSLGNSVFYGSTSLETIRVAEGNANFRIIENALYNQAGNTLLYYPAAKSGTYTVDAATTIIGEGAFAYSRAREILLPESLQTISDNGFASSSIQSIQIPASVLGIGEQAFFCCSSLQDLRFSEGSKLTVIPADAFNSCFMVKSVQIPASVQKLDRNCFSYTGLESISFEKGSCLESVGDFSFSYTPLKRLEIPANTNAIKYGAFYACTKLEHVDFATNSKLNSIGQEAFKECQSLSSIAFPDNLASVGMLSFFRTGLEHVLIGTGLSSIGEGAFASCQSLTSFTVEKGNLNFASYDGVLYNMDKSELILYPAAKEGEYALAAETRLIRGYAFAGASRLANVKYNANLGEIGEHAFSECAAMATPSLPENLVTIGEHAFEYCPSMDTRLTIPRKLKNIGRFAFYNDFNLSDIQVEPESELARLGYGAFGYCGIQDFTVPGNVSTMAQEVFTGCANLLTVTFEADSKLENLPAWAFEGANELRQITFEENSALQIIEARACQGLERLEKVNLLPCTSLNKVGNYAFTQCKSLSTLSLPISITEIGRYAFQGCAALSRIDIPKEVSFVGRYAFIGTDSINIYFKSSIMPADVEENWDYGIAGYYMGVSEVAASGDWTYALTDDGKASVISYNGSDEAVTLDKLDGHEVVSIGGKAFQGNTTLKSIALPDTLTGIYQGAFAKTTALENITIPAKVQVIDNEAFKESGIQSISFAGQSSLASLGRHVFSETKNLSEITLPDGVDKIKDYAFYKSGLTSISFGSESQAAEIGKYAFSQSALESIQLPKALHKIDYYAFCEADSLTSITLNTGADLSIYGNAFYRSGLESITIPANVQYIGELCFTGCSNLTEITVAQENTHYSSENGVLLDKSQKKLIACPAGKTGGYNVASTVTTLAFAAFEESKLSSIQLPADSHLNTIGYRAFYGCANLESINVPDSVQSIDNYAFAECPKLSAVSISNDGQLSGIYKSAFYNCKSLTAITIPDAVQEISDYAFYGCSALTDVAISETSLLKGIYGHAFEYSGMASFTMPENLTEIGEYAFNGAQLSNLVFNDNITDVGDYAFADCGLKNTTFLSIPNTVEYLGSGALKGVTALKELTLPFLGNCLDDDKNGQIITLFACERYHMLESLEKVTLLGGTTIYAGAFENCPHIKSVALPEGITSIGGQAFSYSGIEQINFPSTLKSIESIAFIDTPLEHVKLPDGIEYLKEGVFELTKINSISFPDTLIYIGRNCFKGTKLTDIYIPKNIEQLGDGAFSNCSSLKTIEVSKENKNYASLNGILYNINYTKLITVPCLIAGNIILPDTLKDIGESAFMGCYKMQSIKLPDTLQSIGDHAFELCSGLKEISITDNVQNIGEGCFANCSSLEYVILGKNMKKIPMAMFVGCNQMKKIEIKGTITSIEDYAFGRCENLDTFIFPESLLSIGKMSFQECRKLKYIYIPEKVQEIGEGAFTNCDTLQSITVAENNKTFASKDGILYDASFSDILAVPQKIGPSVVIPEGVAKIGLSAFESCKNLENVSLPSTLLSIETAAFRGCQKLNKITISTGNNIKHIGTHAFLNTAYQENPSNWENDVLYLSKYAIVGKENIQNLKIKPGTITIAESCFYHNQNLKRVIIPDTVKYINKDAFGEDSNITFLRMSKSVKEIDSAAFSRCTKLKSIDIPDGVERVAEFAFNENANLQFIKIGNYDNAFSYAFFGCKNTKTLIAPKYDGNYFLDVVYHGIPSNIVVTKKDKISYNDVCGFLDYDINLYSYADKLLWDENILNSSHESKIYFAGEWNLATFYVDDMILQTDPLKSAEVVQAPAENLINEYLPEGASFLGWDIDGDGKADRLPITLTKDLEANAVYDVPITSISMDTAATVEAGRSITLTATCKPDEYNHDDTITWSSSDTSIATVDENGKVTGITEGEAIITATLQENPSITAECAISVQPVQYGIKLAETSGELNVGDIYELDTEFIFPENDTDKTQWVSSNEKVASVEAGTITALTPGTTDILITHGEYAADYQLTVKAPLLGISLSKEKLNLNVDDTMQMQVTYEPLNTTDDTEAFWYSSKTSVATVNSNGLITAVGPGEATVTAVIGQQRAACTVTVKAPLKWIVLNTTTGTMRIDRTKPLEVIYEPSNTTDNKAVSWTTSNPEIASVDTNGFVTAQKAGTAVITGKVGNLEATYTVTVIGLKDEATGITVTNSDETAMEEGISLNIEELDNGYLQQEYPESWEALQTLLENIASGQDGHIPVTQMYDISLSDSTDTVVQPDAAVDVEIPVSPEAVQDGAVVYRLEDDGTITDMGAVYDEEVGRYRFQTEHFSVYVLGAKSKKNYVMQITLNASEATLCPEETFALAAEILPKELADTPILWSSSNDMAATVSSAGIVTAKQEGTTIITATASDKRKAHADCAITIKHDYQPETTEPTCTEQGYTTLTCSNCGDSHIDANSYTDAKGHSFGAWQEIKSPTCTDSGSEQRACSVCAYTETNGVEPNGHDWDSSPTIDQAPTCTADGSQSTHCKKCNATIDSQVIPAAGHSFGEWESIQSPTCTGSGTKQRACTVCGYIENIGVEPAGHEWDTDFTIDQQPTCIANGSKSIHCRNCDAVKDSVIIPMADHDYQPKVTEPTCTEQGYTTLTCSNCGDSHIDANSYTDAKGHSFGAWQEIKSPTCTDSGSEQRACSVCAYTETNGVEPNGHDWDSSPTIDQAPTCTADGSQSTHCKECDAIKDSTAIPATSHTSDQGTITTAPTCKADGRKTYRCAICQETIKTEPIERLPHTCQTTTTKATTKKNGSKAEICTACGETIATTPIYYPKAVALSKTSYTYTGKATKPKATVKDSSGRIIPPSNYTVKYSNNKAVGKAMVEITFKGLYSGTISKSFTINPKGTSLTKTAAKGKGLTIKWKKQPSQITAYEIQYSTEKKFPKKASVTKTVKKTSATNLTIKKVKAKKKYYIRIRTYKTIKKTKYYSNWSKVKTATVKK